MGRHAGPGSPGSQRNLSATTVTALIEHFQIVLLYDQFSSIGRAMDTYAHVTQELDPDLLPRLRIWRIDVAVSAEFSSRANEDLAEAGLIIVTVRPDFQLPTILRPSA